jgi:hypothetical protein
MTQLAYYQKYLEKIDECLLIHNNPDKAIVVCKLLFNALEKYRKLDYNKFYFEGYYNNLYYSLKNYAYEADFEKIVKECDLYFNTDTQEALEILSNILDRLTLIIQSNDDNDFIDKVNRYLAEVNNESFLTDSEIFDYQKRAKALLDEHNYTPSKSQTLVVEKKQNKGCLFAIILLLPNLIINLFKN